MALCACSSETIVRELTEKEANEILELLDDREIPAQKVMNATGRVTYYEITVSASDKMKAIRELNKNDLPRRKDMGYAEVFASGGLIPTSAEEKAKKLAALEGEIERQLKLINGVLDVQVQIVMPEESALRTTQQQEPSTTASATIKYLPGAGGSRPLSEPEVQAIVAAGVEKLMPENVVVLMRPAAPPPDVKPAVDPACTGTGFCAMSQKKCTITLVAILVVIALLCAGLLGSMLRLRTVRGRLIRLQNEIAKARSKKSEAALAPAGGGGQPAS